MNTRLYYLESGRLNTELYYLGECPTRHGFILLVTNLTMIRRSVFLFFHFIWKLSLKSISEYLWYNLNYLSPQNINVFYVTSMRNPTCCLQGKKIYDTMNDKIRSIRCQHPMSFITVKSEIVCRVESYNLSTLLSSAILCTGTHRNLHFVFPLRQVMFVRLQPAAGLFDERETTNS